MIPIFFRQPIEDKERKVIVEELVRQYLRTKDKAFIAELFKLPFGVDSVAIALEYANWMHTGSLNNYTSS